MEDAFTYSADDLRIDRDKVTENVWNTLLAISNDPEGYADEDHFYLDAAAEIEFQLYEDGGVSWGADSFTVENLTFSNGEVYFALCRALDQQSASIEDRYENVSGVSWRASSPWNGSWRAA